MAQVSKYTAPLLLLLATLLFSTSAGAQSQTHKSQSQRPNIVLILADDARPDDVAYMPHVNRKLKAHGTTFSNAFVSYAACCPSRTTILRGQYAHNHGVLGVFPPLGGFKKFYELGLGSSTVATWLDRKGYETAFFGKYLNGYCKVDQCPTERTYVPPDWDAWYAWVRPDEMNVNGQLVKYAADSHGDDMLTKRAVGFVKRKGGKSPLFIHLSYSAPHYPADVAPRHSSSFEDKTAPRPPSFNEDTSDKPVWLAEKPPLDSQAEEEIDAFYRKRLGSLLAADDGLQALFRVLRDKKQLRNTYFVFTSDNGFHLGEHRLPRGKQTPYEESIRVPLIVRGPDIPKAAVRDEMVLNTDLAPTFARLGGRKVPTFVDGRSLVPLLRGKIVPWRNAFLVENWGGPMGDYSGIRTEDELFVEYINGEREYYHLKEDPYQLSNAYSGLDESQRRNLTERLNALKSCQSSGCVRAEDGS